jgi:hypothetical protein
LDFGLRIEGIALIIFRTQRTHGATLNRAQNLVVTDRFNIQHNDFILAVELKNGRRKRDAVAYANAQIAVYFHFHRFILGR